MIAIREAIGVVTNGSSLTMDQAALTMGEIMRGETSDAQIGALLAALRLKGETAEELCGFALTMRSYARPVRPRRRPLLDTCGTGGDGTATFNISTATAFVAAGMGLAVAKHGNRAVSSRCGSADVMSALGVNIELEAEQMAGCIDEAGIGFLFAPRLHPAMRHVAAARRELGIRTLFNMLGPLTNPASAETQLIGAFSDAAAKLMAEVVALLETPHALVVYSADGLDEFSCGAPTQVYEVRDGEVQSYVVDAQSFGLPSVPAAALHGGDAEDSAALIRALLGGAESPGRHVVLLNAAAAAYVGGLVEGIAEGLESARRSIDDGAALAALDALCRVSSRGEESSEGVAV